MTKPKPGYTLRSIMIWSLAGTISVALTVIVFFPASWIAVLLEKQTAGRLTLGDAHGTLWRGSAFIGGSASSNDPVTPLLPGRFIWHLSPMILLGSVDLELENDAALPQPINVSGNWRELKATPGMILLPAERLAALGAPLNTVQPSGQMRLSWGSLQVTQQNGTIGMAGTMKLEIDRVSSRLSPVKPLGSYNFTFVWRGTEAAATLKTTQGPMLLNGSGIFSNGRLQFSGTAQAEAGQDERLANFINLLGQHRREGDKDVIALEFK